MFQHNGNGTVNISGFYLKSAGKLYRACGNCTNSYQRHVVIDNVILDDAELRGRHQHQLGRHRHASPASPCQRLEHHVCAKYKGVAKGSEPSYLGDGWNDANCKVKQSDITYR